MSRSRQLLMYVAWMALLLTVASQMWLHLPLVVTLALAVVLAAETCWSIFESSR